MRLISHLICSALATSCLFLAGCDGPVVGPVTTTTSKTSPSPSVAADGATDLAPQTGTETADTGSPAGTSNKPLPDGVAADSGTVTLTPENTKIEFVGTHAGEKPDPRVGTFEKFAGKIEVDAATKTLKSVSIEIDTNSLTTQFPKLTDHLKSPDFLEVREYPAIKFESTKIEAADGGEQKITGNLTLHGVTKEITIPAKVDVVDGAPTLQSEFSIDRTEYKINFAPDKVEKKVSLTVSVGGKK